MVALAVFFLLYHSSKSELKTRIDVMDAERYKHFFARQSNINTDTSIVC